MSADKESSTVTYRHELNHSFKKKGIKHVMKEMIIDGAKGLSFMFLKKIGEDSFYKIYGEEKSSGVYRIEEQTGPDKDALKSSEKTEDRKSVV